MAARFSQEKPGALSTPFAPTRRGGVAPPPAVRDHIRRAGEPLPPELRRRMESSFGTYLGQVRIHRDHEAARLTGTMEANAFTLGSHISFAPGRYQPGTPGGEGLIAHEITHVMQQASGAPVLQCDKQSAPKKKEEKAVAKPAAPQSKGQSVLELPWEHGIHTLFEEESSGIQFLIAVAQDERPNFEAVIPAIAKRVAGDNKLVKDPSMQVKTVIIARPTTTRFAHLNGVPVLMIDPADADLPTIAHEMGHGVFHYLKGRGASKEKDAASAGAFRLKMGDIYARLSATKEVEIDGDSIAAGLWMVDPSQWSPGSKREHPWDDPDEFFASAKAAFQTDRKGLQASIAKFSKIDPAVAAPARELMALLESFLGKGTLPARSGLTTGRAKTAADVLLKEQSVSKVEDTIMPDTPLDWLLHPAQRPKKVSPRPGFDRP